MCGLNCMFRLGKYEFFVFFIIGVNEVVKLIYLKVMFVILIRFDEVEVWLMVDWCEVKVL